MWPPAGDARGGLPALLPPYSSGPLWRWFGSLTLVAVIFMNFSVVFALKLLLRQLRKINRGLLAMFTTSGAGAAAAGLRLFDSYALASKRSYF